MRPLIVGNWKMNGLTAQLADIVALTASMKARSARADVINALLVTLDDRDRELVEQALPVLEALVLEAQFGDRA